MSEMVERVAKAMQQRAKEPLYNIKSLEPVLVGSLGDAWECLARAAIEAMREPTNKMKINGSIDPGSGGPDDDYETEVWQAMINAALKD